MTCSPYLCSADRARLLDAARAAGACAAGFAPLHALTPAESEPYTRWLESGRHAGMDYMERYGELRANPSQLHPGAQTALCMAFPYGTSHRHPLIADYALGADYHTVLRRAVEPVTALMHEMAPDSSTRVCIDTAPVRERVLAVRAGLGTVGMNNLLIVPGVGTKVFLVEIFWSQPVEASRPLADELCTRCGACVAACPGHALSEDGSLDSRRCLSYLTIEHRGPLPEETSLRKRRIYGCDICQDACPHNRTAPPQNVLPEFMPSEALAGLTLEIAADISDADFRRIFRNSAVKRTKAEGLRRNAAKALEL